MFDRRRNITPTQLWKRRETLRASIVRAGQQDAQRASLGLEELREGALELCPPLAREGSGCWW